MGKSNVLTIEHLMGFYTSTQLLQINLKHSTVHKPQLLQESVQIFFSFTVYNLQFTVYILQFKVVQLTVYSLKLYS